MIDPTQAQAFQRDLSETRLPLYAMLDGASIPNLLALLPRHGLTSVCLLPGELEPELAQAAPYLVELDAQSPFAELLLNEGIGRHWGILAVANADLRRMRMHFRQLVSVWDPDGRPLHFRYYDPRVLRIYLPTCNAGELAAFFGPVAAFYAEDATPDTLVRFTVAATGLGQQRLSLARSASPA